MYSNVVKHISYTFRIFSYKSVYKVVQTIYKYIIGLTLHGSVY